VKEEDQLKKNSQFELHNKTYHNLLTGLIILDTGKIENNRVKKLTP